MRLAMPIAKPAARATTSDCVRPSGSTSDSCRAEGDAGDVAAPVVDEGKEVPTVLVPPAVNEV